MNSKKIILFALGAASLALPAAAVAQPYGQPYYGQPYGRPYDPGYQRPDYGQPRGDWYDRGRGFPGYPEFRGAEAHIRQEISEAVREDMIEPEDARDLGGQLQRIRMQEAREFGAHGWNLPDDDRARIRAQLDRLDHEVDEIRDEQ